VLSYSESVDSALSDMDAVTQVEKDHGVDLSRAVASTRLLGTNDLGILLRDEVDDPGARSAGRVTRAP